MSERRYLIDIEIMTRAVFSVADLWPDGDAPEVVTEADVSALIGKTASRRLADDWFFPSPDIQITVTDVNKLSPGNV